MAAFDQLIRGALDVTYPRRIVKLDDAVPDNVVLRVGDNGSAKTLGFSRSYSLTTYMEKRRKQKKASKRHVMRIIGKTKDSNGNAVDEPSAWIDVERDDETTTEEGGGLDYQETKQKFEWYLDDEGKEPNGARDTTKVIVIPPDADPDDPYLWFELEANDTILCDEAGQEIKRKFDNTKRNTERRKQPNEVRRVVHSDTPYDSDPKYANGGIIRDYEKTPDTKDKDQYLDIEVLGRYAFDDYRADPHVKPVFEHWQRTIVDRDEEDLQAEIDATEETDKTYADDEIGPPWRLDALQRIVNVQISLPEAAVLGTTPSPSADNSNSGSSTQSSEDGEAWDASQFGGGTSSAASGFGRTVVCAGKEFIAFGKPDDGSKCFIRVKGLTIRRGVLDEKGKLEWSSVGTLPVTLDDFSGAQSCSFAGGAFFISYLPGGSDSIANTYLAVSFDGETFQYGIKPFQGVLGVANGSVGPDITEHGAPEPGPKGGSVTYDKKNKVYVTTGSYLRSYVAQYFTDDDDGQFDSRFGDLNFMSSVSKDGVKWTPKFDTSEGSGIHNSVSNGTIWAPGEVTSSVCFGRGRFVAASGFKTRHLFTIPPGISFTYQANPVCGVATSSDGKDWINRQLPGVISGLEVFGQVNAVGFYKTGGTDENGYPKGFFTAAGFEFKSDPILRQSKIWVSDDGLSWKLVQTDSDKDHWILSTINKLPGKIIKV